MLKIVAVAVGGSIGATTRYLVSTWAAGRFGTAFPYGTLTINLLACLFIGMMVSFCLRHPEMPLYWKLFVITGCLGGFSTFSTFSLEAFELLAQQTLSGFLYLALSIMGGLAMVAFGMHIF